MEQMENVQNLFSFLALHHKKPAISIGVCIPLKVTKKVLTVASHNIHSTGLLEHIHNRNTWNTTQVTYSTDCGKKKSYFSLFSITV